MKKKINVKNNFMRRLSAFILAFVMAAATATVSPLAETVVAQAATYVQGNQSISLNDEMVTLYVDGWNYQLTKAGMVSDAGMYTDTYPIVVMRWKGDTLFGYCYDLQKDSLKLVLLDTGVTSLLSSGTGENRVITGYVSNGTTKSLPTLEQFKSKLNGSSSSSNNSGNNGNNNNGSGNSSTATTGKPVVLNNTVTYSDGSRLYFLSSDKPVISAANNSEGTTFIHFSDGSLCYWNYALEKNLPTVTLHQVTSKANALVVDSNGDAVSYYDANGYPQTLPTLAQISSSLNNSSTASQYNSSLEGSTAYLTVKENGYYNKVKVTNSSNLQNVGHDAIGSIYLYYGKTLKVWNYPLQKAETTKNLVSVSTSCTGLAFVSPNSNQIVGYYENGTFKSLWTLDQIKTKVSTLASYTKFSRVITNGTYKLYQDSNGKTMRKLRLIGNKFYYNDKLIAIGGKVKFAVAGFSGRSKHYALVRASNGSAYVYNPSTGHFKKWLDASDNVVGWVYSKNKDGSITHAKLKNGTKKIVPNAAF